MIPIPACSRSPTSCYLNLGQLASKLNVRHVLRKQCRDARMMLDPRLHPRRDPTGHIENAPIILVQAPPKDRLVVSDPIPQCSQVFQRAYGPASASRTCGEETLYEAPASTALSRSPPCGERSRYDLPSEATKSKTPTRVQPRSDLVLMHGRNVQPPVSRRQSDSSPPVSSPAAGLSYHSAP